MSESGRVKLVELVTLGSSAVADALTGGFTITVDDAADFTEDGGTLLTGGLTYAYASVDDETGIVTLAEPLTADVLTDDPVAVYDAQQGGVSVEYVASVMPDDDTAGGDTLEVVIDSALMTSLSGGLGMRDGLGEAIVYDLDGDTWRAVAFPGQAVTLSTLNGAGDVVPVEPRTDGVPPAFSPVPRMMAGIGTIFITWDAVENHDPVTYDVYLSAASPVVQGPATFAGSMNGTLFLARTLPDGTPLANGVNYFATLVARDEDGAAAMSAEATGQAIAKITATEITDHSISTPQLATNAITTDLLLANDAWIGALHSVSFYGETITGPVIQTMSSATQGIKLDGPNNQLVGYSGGAVSFLVDANAGSLFANNATVTGSFASAPPGSGARIVVSASNPKDVQMWSGNSGEIAPGYIRADWVPSGSVTFMQTVIGSPRYYSHGAAQIILEQGQDDTTVSVMAGLLYVSSFADFAGPVTFQDNVYVDADMLSVLGTSQLSLDIKQSGDLSGGKGMIGSANNNMALCWGGTPANLRVTAYFDQTNYQAIAASAFTVSSDARDKTNLVEVTSALEAIRSLTVYDYDTPHGAGMTMMEGPMLQGVERPAPVHLTHRQRGILAQDLKTVAPHAVSYDGETDRNLVDLYGLMSTTIAALQELSGAVDELRGSAA